MNEDLIAKWNNGEWTKLKRLDLITLVGIYEDLWKETLIKVNNEILRVGKNESN